ncbi:YfgM family protein [Candidatus Steffania adelgidicola]|uniref:YfgM family protein n=1 Tax=Candidatus Steffania adelgidicola TaxID=1076626 RepID=UPI001D002E67|nr:tetratricopeptide repeat protein [Candidatus Steffania adelgidicola]UDG80018.1 hypothetical protein GFK82_00571 [Candidatus Steffania adelgidicola]
MALYTMGNKPRAASRYFFTDKAQALAISVVIGIFTLIGFSYWDYNHHKDGIIAVSSVWKVVTANQKENNNMGAFSSLELARQHVERGEFSTVEMHLKKALSQTRESNLQAVIRLRLARVQMQQKNIEGALNTLDGVKGQGWAALAEDIRGDAKLIKGDNQAARLAYEQALQSAALQSLVRMKLNNLSS